MALKIAILYTDKSITLLELVEIKARSHAMIERYLIVFGDRSYMNERANRISGAI